ncbi:MAG: zinc ABC transporter substrate-binding protein, partial [Spirochaetota bacterium]
MRKQRSIIPYIVLHLLITTMAVYAGGKGEVKSEPPASTIHAFVSILPQVYFVERIGGERVKVQELVGPGREPHTYEPTPGQMAALSQAKVYFRIGVAFEKALMPRIQNSMKNLTIVDTNKGIKYRKSDAQSHAGEGDDPHIWMSPLLAK